MSPTGRHLAPLLGVLLLGACVTRAPLPNPSGNPNEGNPLSLKLPSYPEGTPHDLTTDRGQVVLLDVWATWCEPCKDALPIYQDLWTRLQARGLHVYAINVDEDTREIGPFLKRTGVTLPVLLDPGGAFAEKSLRVQVMPTTFLLDRRGIVRQVHEGVNENLAAQIGKYEAEIDKLLAEPAP